MNQAAVSARDHDAILRRAAALTERIARWGARERPGRRVAGTLSLRTATFIEALRHHFEDEESGGFLEEVGTEHPELTDRIESCRAAHLQLLVQFGEVEAALRDADGRAVELARNGLTRLQRHERAENDILFLSYWVDTGAGD